MSYKKMPNKKLLLQLTFLIILITETCGNDCSGSKYECCLDGVTPANGPHFEGCATTAESSQTIENDLGNKLAEASDTCALPEPQSSCYDYQMQWRYSMKDGRCVQYWYGGCDGNANSFDTLDQCEGKCVQPNGTDICRLALVNPTSICHYNQTRYYYDSNLSKCKEFVYSGCLGNANNFETLHDCQRKCQTPLLFEQCSLIPKKGPCHGDHKRWYYNSLNGRCEQFSYGGCLKNKNNYIDQGDCVESCVKPKQKAVCLLPKIRGNCDQNVEAFYYDFTSGMCKKFMYSGCNGNLNRFESLESCQYTCQGLNVASYKNELVQEQICNAPKISGQCHLKLQRWYFNRTTQMCHQFTYSGCDANANNFEAEVDCREACNAKEVDPCVLPVEAGSCADYKIYWYFNQAEKECVRFYYGGCDGNQNRYENRESCEFQCKLSAAEKNELLKLPKQCIQAVHYGEECAPLEKKWHYDTGMKLCYPFDYTGCGPKDTNRFESSKECEQTCTQNNQELETTTALATIKPEHIDDIFICDLPMEVGNCSQRINKWFYDRQAKYCREFEFTGCYGNDNKFESREQCVQICEQPKRREICHSKKMQGPCQAFESRWFHDAESKSCKQFQYGGCLANENNFASKAACLNFCWSYLSPEARVDTAEVPELTTTTSTNSSSDLDKCKLPKKEGTICSYNNNNAISNRWYFDQSIRACQIFSYYGCNGNENNFDSESVCEDECEDNSILDISNLNSKDNVCQDFVELKYECLDKDGTNIIASQKNGPSTVWFYDIETRSCQQINMDCIIDSATVKNKFDSFASCHNQCLPGITQANPTQADCLLPMDIGNKCTLQVWRWYYDTKAGECYQFSYSGCLGNNNNFATSQKCIWLCASVGTDKCPSMESCGKECEFGKVKSLNGCDMCECLNPCADTKCSANKKCIVQDSKATCTIDTEKGAEFSIEPFPEKIEVFIGSKLILPCKASGGYPSLKIAWFKDYHELVFDAFNQKIYIGQANTLVISNLTVEDSGTYSCRASVNEKSLVQETNLIVMAESNEVYALYGRDVAINCNVTDALSKVEWKTENYKIKPNPYKYLVSGNSLIIKRFHYSDIGTYTCTDVATERSQTITIKRAIGAKVKFRAYNISGDINTSILLSCNHTGIPRADITWYTPNNLRIVVSTVSSKYRLVNDSYLEIKQLQESDAGTYKCSAINEFTYKFLRNRVGAVNLNVYSPPIIVSKFGKYYSKHSSDILLKCEAKGLPKPDISWYKENKLILSKDHTEPSYKYKFSLSNGSLAIYNLNSDDEGVYYCYASSLDSFPVSSLNYTIKVIKSLVKNSDTIQVNETEDATLSCQLPEDEEFLKISWNFNETNTIETKSLLPYQLHLNGTKLSDSGDYECYAETNTSNYLTKITVEVMPRTVVVETNLKEISSTKGSAIVLDCTWWFTTNSLFANGKNMPMNLTRWTINGTEITESDNLEFIDSYRTILKLKKADVSETNNLYSCVFNMNKYEIKTSKFSLFIGVKPFVRNHITIKNNNTIQWFNEYKAILFQCPLEGIPDVTRNWFFNGNRINSADDRFDIDTVLNTILIKKLDESLQGTYMCNASNLFGYDIVKYDVKQAVKMNIIEPAESSIEIAKHDNVTITCDFNRDAKPTPLVSWFINGRPFKGFEQRFSTVNNRLAISNAEVSDSGNYTCILSNGYHPEQKFVYSLQVSEAPQIQFIPRSPLFQIGTKATLTCTLDKNPEKISRVFWYKNGVALKEQANKYSISHTELIFHNVESSDSGRYTCKLRIGKAYLKRRVHVDVTENDPTIGCEDISSYSNCRLVKTQSLCYKWGKFCCRTCTQAGYKIN